MKKLIGTVRVTPNPGDETTLPHFDVVFAPYSGKMETPTVEVNTYDELVDFLISIRISEDEAARWAGRAKASVVLIPNIERPEQLLRDCGLVG
jgi:hypothetical protein